MPRESTTEEVRNDFSNTVNRVGYGRERVVITRRGRRLAAIVPIADLDRIMRDDAKSSSR